MDEDEIVKAWQKALKPTEQVVHSADWLTIGEFLGPSTHPMYDADVNWPDRDEDRSPCFLRNLRPAWWPKPEWVTVAK